MVDELENEDRPLLSIIIPAHNEQENIAPTLRALHEELTSSDVPHEFIVVDDASEDETAAVCEQVAEEISSVRVFSKSSPCGLGRAIRHGLPYVRGGAVAIVMADLSDNPKDVVRCYEELCSGFDCVFGTRFHPESSVTDYPPVKLFVNRIANRFMQVLFLTSHNDLTNAFKMYRRHVIESISPLHAAHFNITIEMSLSALIRRYKISSIPINWAGRTWGQSKLRVSEMGRRYMCTMLMIWFERLLILDDVIAESSNTQGERWSRR